MADHDTSPKEWTRYHSVYHGPHRWFRRAKRRGGWPVVDDELLHLTLLANVPIDQLDDNTHTIHEEDQDITQFIQQDEAAERNAHEEFECDEELSDEDGYEELDELAQPSQPTTPAAFNAALTSASPHTTQSPASNANLISHIPANFVLPPRVLVLVSVLRDTDGRDKICKILQYGGRVIPILYHAWVKQGQHQPAATLANVSPSLNLPYPLCLLPPFTSALSSCRRLIRFMKWCYLLPAWAKAFDTWRIETRAHVQPSPPFSFSHPHPPHLLARLPWLSSVELLDLSLAILTDVFDDVELLAKYGAVSAGLGARAGRMSLWLWLTTVILDLGLTLRILRHYAYQHKELSGRIHEIRAYMNAFMQEMEKRKIKQINKRDKEKESKPPISSLLPSPSALSLFTSPPSLPSSHSSLTPLLHRLFDLSTQLAAVQLSRYHQRLNLAKFLFDLLVAVPMAFARTDSDTLIQSAGFCSGLVGLYKLLITIKPAT